MFFEAERQFFFRPLGGKRRELVVACLRTLYDRLHGPGADYAHNLTREALRDVLMPAVQALANEIAAEAPVDDDELSQLDGADGLQLANALIRSLLKDGWLETFGDRAGLVTAYRFTRAGKLFAEALWTLDRVRARSRQRNVRSCRNALAAARRNLDGYDLIDAYDYAEKVIGDLSEGIDYFQDLVRRLMSEASATPWDEFLDFLDRFERDFKKQLTADNIERHRQAIRDAVQQLRQLDTERLALLEMQLADIAPWANPEQLCASRADWLLERIEDIVEAACTNKYPELIKAMNVYMRRATSIVQQALMMKSGQQRHAFTRAISRVSALEGEAQSAMLERLGAAMSAAQVRVLDPASFKLRTLSQRRRALSVTALPKVTRDARLAAAMHSAEAGAFALSNATVVDFIRRELAVHEKPLRLSTLPIGGAADVLQAMQVVEAVRSGQDKTLKATRLPTRLANDYYSANDYQIEVIHEPDPGTP